jgi:hypothetical protein
MVREPPLCLKIFWKAKWGQIYFYYTPEGGFSQPGVWGHLTLDEKEGRFNYNENPVK